MMALRVRFFVLVWTFWACLAPLNAWAADRILELAHWEDKTAAVKFEQLPQVASFKPYDTILNKGFDDSADWIRVKIAARKAQEPEQLVLLIRPIYIDRIELFDPADTTVYQKPRLVGDLVPWADAEYESIHHAFVVPALSKERYVWLRLQTNSTRILHIDVLTTHEMVHQDSHLMQIYAALMAVLLSFWLFILIGWFQARDTISSIFVLRQLTFLLYAAGFLGYLRYLGHGYLSPQAVDYAYSWLAILICSLSFLFESRFLNEYNLPRWTKHARRVVAVLLFIAPVLLLADQTVLALRINMMVTGVLCLLLFAMSLAIRPSAASCVSTQATDSRYLLPKSVVCMYYGILLFILVYYILPALGLSKASVWTAYGALFYSVIAGLMMTVLLIYRAKKIEDLRLSVSTQLLKSEAELLAETRRRHDQSRLLSMLMHEIKTPLAVIDMAMAKLGHEQKTSGYVERAIDNMKTILDRCVQTDRMLEEGFQIKKQRVQLSEQLRVWAQDRKEGAHRFELNLEPALQIDTDFQCLQIIVNNLFENAFKHGHAEAALTVRGFCQSSEEGRHGILLEFSNLPGSSEWPDESQVFTKYYRSAKAQRQSGTGLGLYLSRNLAEQLGGSLRYRTAEGRIIFDLWLPS